MSLPPFPDVTRADSRGARAGPPLHDAAQPNRARDASCLKCLIKNALSKAPHQKRLIKSASSKAPHQKRLVTPLKTVSESPTNVFDDSP